jgi:glucose-1-phosphate adenylyltransferase
VTEKRLYAYQFQGYWKDVGTINSYYEANMEWLNALPRTHRLAESDSVIAQKVRIHRTAEVIQSILMPGVVIGPNARVCRAILDENVRVESGACIGLEDSDHAISVIPANSLIQANAKIHEDSSTSFQALCLDGY